ncbi:MAG: PilZ domain-containing protein [Syntrophobacterales bacterium]|nr:MAG: PilZ domain-containing protein [Syntrophobacterales bacterium]
MKLQAAPKERRKYRRFELINLVVYKQFEIEKITKTINLSIGGMKMRTEFPVPLHEELEIAIKIDDDIFRSQGKVVYTNERKDGNFDIGVNFINSPEESLNLLSQYLSQRE